MPDDSSLDESRYYYEKQNGSLVQIRNFWPTKSFDAENLANHKDLGVFFPRTGKFTDANGCSVQFEQFYVGTKAHLLSQYRQIDLARYFRDHPGHVPISSGGIFHRRTSTVFA